MANAPIDRQAGEVAGTPPQQLVNWDTSELKSSYCNVASAASARDEVVLNFGVNRSADEPSAELAVELLHRIALSPFAAKRLEELLIKVIKDYESVHGEVK